MCNLKVTLTCIDLLICLSQVHAVFVVIFLCMCVVVLLSSNKEDEKKLPTLQKSSIFSFPKQGVCGILTFQCTKVSNIVLLVIQERTELS